MGPMLTIRVRQTVFWLLLSSAACGSNDASSAPPAASKLTTLSSVERNELCDAYAKQLDGLFTSAQYLTISCTHQSWPTSFTFIPDAGLGLDPKACSQQETICEHNGGTFGSGVPATSLSVDLFDQHACEEGVLFAGCQASVSDYTRCTDAVSKQLGVKLALVRCDVMGDAAAIDRSNLNVASLPECAALSDQCADLLPDSLVDGVPEAGQH
jgi:hypothetical protein